MSKLRQHAVKMVASRAISTILTSEKMIAYSEVDQIKIAEKSPVNTLSYLARIKKGVPSPILTIAIVLLALCTALSLNAKTNHTIAYLNAISDQISTQSIILSIESKQDVIPEKNSLYIPKLNVLTQISEGEYEDEKKYTNAWRRTHTSTPEDGGNTVIVGHRYRDNTPDYPLYNIDQILKDDEIVVYWDEKKYVYNVFNTVEVHETAIEIEDDTEENILTLYACDWSGKNRLVVQARLQEK